jgi:hypothetical protein
VKPGGVFLALKGPAAVDELSEAQKAVCLLGGTVERLFGYDLPGGSERRSIVVIRKSAPSPKNYPAALRSSRAVRCKRQPFFWEIHIMTDLRNCSLHGVQRKDHPPVYGPAAFAALKHTIETGARWIGRPPTPRPTR